MIDIYFLIEARITSFWSQLWPTLLGSLAALGVAYFIYYLNKLNDRKRLRLKHESIYNSYLFVIKQVTLEFDNVFKSFDDYKSSIQMNIYAPCTPKRIVTNSFTRLLQFDSMIYESLQYLSNKKPEDGWLPILNEIHQNLDYLEGNNNELKRIISTYNNEYGLVEIDINDNIEYVHRWTILNSQKQEYKDVFIKYSEIYKRIVKASRKVVLTEYITPYIDELISLDDNYEGCRLIIDKLAYSAVQIQRLEKTNLIAKETYEVIEQDLRIYIIKLGVLTTELKSVIDK